MYLLFKHGAATIFGSLVVCESARRMKGEGEQNEQYRIHCTPNPCVSISSKHVP